MPDTSPSLAFQKARLIIVLASLVMFLLLFLLMPTIAGFVDAMWDAQEKFWAGTASTRLTVPTQSGSYVLPRS